MKVSEVQITNFQLQQLFEEFNSRLTVDGINAKYSWFMYKNSEAMAPLYSQLMSELYDERKEPDFPAMFSEGQALIEKYRDRDAEGKEINDKAGNAQFTQHREDYVKEYQALREKYKELFEKIDKKQEVNREIYMKTVSFMATQLELSEFPNNTKPYIIGLLGY
jgi:predicted nuclease with TOPRIM domain